jgi:hypothetical protein
MPDLPSARIAHLTTRRLRIKVPEKRRDVAFFDFVQGRLAAWDSVERVETNPLTASILVHFSDAERLLLEMVAKNDFLDIDFDTITQPAELVVTGAAARSFAASDHALRSWTQNQIDMRSVVFLEACSDCGAIIRHLQRIKPRGERPRGRPGERPCSVADPYSSPRPRPLQGRRAETLRTREAGAGDSALGARYPLGHRQHRDGHGPRAF